MRSFRWLALVLLLAAVLMSCSQAATTASPTPTPTLPSPASVHAYLARALDIMQQYSINRKIINWPKLRQETFTRAEHAVTFAQTYPAIRFALSALGDHHSFLEDPQTAKQKAAAKLPPDEYPSGRPLPGGIGYLRLPELLDAASQQANLQYAQTAQNVIREIDQTGNTCGWIVDLRESGGGTMWPLLLGVGPILGEGTVGYFVFPDGSKQAWSYRDGQVQVGGSPGLTIAGAYQLKHPNPPVAVLTDSMTGSAGEAIVVAFRGRPQTRSFGDWTAGVPTANQGFVLSDGAILVITVALDADRTGQTYDGPIPPDQLVISDPSQIGTSADPVIPAAASWLRTQPACQG